MSYFTSQVLNGLSAATVYALLAVGFSVVYGVLRLLNFAHFEVFTIGAFVGYGTLHALPGSTPPAICLVAALALSSIVCSVAAGTLYYIAYRPIQNEPPVRSLVTAIGASMLFQHLGIAWLSPHTRGYPSLALNVSPQLVAVIGLIALSTLHYYVVFRTRIGLELRAVADSKRAAALMGIWPGRTILCAFMIGGAYAGTAGVIWGIVYGTVNPQMGYHLGIKSFIIAVLGGRGRLSGILIMSLLIGVLESLIGGYLPSEYSVYRDTAVLILLALLLRFKYDGVNDEMLDLKV